MDLKSPATFNTNKQLCTRHTHKTHQSKITYRHAITVLTELCTTARTTTDTVITIQTEMQLRTLTIQARNKQTHKNA